MLEKGVVVRPLDSGLRPQPCLLESRSELYVILSQLRVVLGYTTEEDCELKQRLHLCSSGGVSTRVGVFINTAVLVVSHIL